MSNANGMKLFYLVLLSFQNVFHALAMRHSRADNRPKYFASSVIILSEAIKFSISSFILYRESRLRRAFANIYYDTFDFIRTCIPALVYVVQNNFLLFALSHLDTTVFQVTYQLKLLTTTIVSVLLLGKSVSRAQWVSQVILFIGVAVVQVQENAGEKSNMNQHQSSSTAGLLAVLVSCLLSGFAAVYFEKILKGSGKSLWARNLELSLSSIVIAVVGQVVSESDKVEELGFFYGFDWLVWALILLQSLGGLIVALVVKYADNILKGFACSASIVITCIISIVFFDASFSLSFLFGTACVVLAVFIYSAFPSTQMPHKLQK